MRLHIEGKINTYYVQMLCMVFFPGTKFTKEANDDANEPSLDVRMVEENGGYHAYATMSVGERCVSRDQFCAFSAERTKERTAKIAVGGAVMNAGAKLLGYSPAWGMLTGVRPAKMAMELLKQGKTPEQTRHLLVEDYFAFPKKAALATEVALAERALVGTPDPRDCSLYVSIPFCPTRCAYCSFVSYTSKRLLSLIPEYLVALNGEIRQLLSQIQRMGLHLKTVYIGGGTPTILDSDQLRMLLDTIAQGTDVSALEEYTLESGRPDTITAEKLKVAKDYGVTRISVNPQTLSDEVLQYLGRSHTTEDFMCAYHIARESGISCINTDLIAGLPGDKFKTFARSFDQILALDPENITVHTFCVKKAAEALFYTAMTAFITKITRHKCET